MNDTRKILYLTALIPDFGAIDNINSILKPLLGDSELSVDKVIKIAESRHNPKDFVESMITLADRYASGGNSGKQGAQTLKQLNGVAMRSVFETIYQLEKGHSYKKILPLVNVSLEESFFPQQANEYPGKRKPEELWKSFKADILALETKTLDSFIESAYFILEKHTSRIPYNIAHSHDVSLFHHLKITAAFSLSIYDYCKEENINEISAISDRKPFLLIGGDVSGIQKFIYNIIASGAAKNLKGRSFYLQLMVDTIVQYIIDELQLYTGNIIYASGGSFYILAPNTDAIKNKIAEIENVISNKIFSEHGTNLSLALDFTEFGEQTIIYKENTPENIGGLWALLVEQLSLKKGKKLKSIMVDNYSRLFEVEQVNCKEKRDAITMDELGIERETLADNSVVNLSTYQQIELGTKLKSTNYLIVAKQSLLYLDNPFSIQPLGLGIFYYFLSEDDLRQRKHEIHRSGNSVKIVFFNNVQFFNTQISKGAKNVNSYTWYGGNDYPKDKNVVPKDFEQLTGKDGNTEGPNLARLGVLRMDVDNLGAIFKNGIPAHMRTFSRYAALSGALDYFFKGYINRIWKSKPEFKEYTQIIYSGGDDLFIVGKWDVLIDMATEIVIAFKKWTCENAKLTISGGMASVTAKFPILKGAQYSEAFEKAAKSHKYGETEKNAFSFVANQMRMNNEIQDILFAFDWTNEMPYITMLKNQLKDYLKKEELSSGISSDLLNLMEQAEFYFDKDKKRFLPKKLDVIWLIAYKFKRAQKKDNDSLKTFYMEWVQNIMAGKIEINKVEQIKDTIYHPLQILAIAARWAALEQRSELTKK